MRRNYGVSSASASPPSGATTYSYDGAGNLASASTGLSASYSLRGHMVEVTPPGGAAIKMAYTDATQDRRILAGDTRMAYNQLGLSSQGPTSATSKATWFTRDPEGTLVAMLNAQTSDPDLYYLFDGLGSVAATTDVSGNLVRRYAYEPYGEEIDRSATDANPWRTPRATTTRRPACLSSAPVLHARPAALDAEGPSDGQTRCPHDAQLLRVRGRRPYQHH